MPGVAERAQRPDRRPVVVEQGDAGVGGDLEVAGAGQPQQRGVVPRVVDQQRPIAHHAAAPGLRQLLGPAARVGELGAVRGDGDPQLVHAVGGQPCDERDVHGELLADQHQQPS